MLLIELPSELLLVVLSLLPIRDVLKCKRLCRSIHDILTNSVLIQYKTELFCARQHDMNDDLGSEALSESRYSVSIHDRLMSLNQVLTGWKNLTFARHSVLTYPFSPSYVYELSGGKLILGSSGGGIPHLNGTSHLHVWDLPPRTAELQDADYTIKWKSLALPFGIADFALDVSQNLLVLVERSAQTAVNLHLYTFDEAIPHPDASTPVLQMPNQGAPNAIRLYWVTIHVCGPILACNFISPRDAQAFDFLVVWNWRTGKVLGQIAGSKLLSFVLLSESVIAIANLDQETIDTYSIDTDPSSLVLLQRFVLPRLTGDEDERPWSYDEALLRAYPNPSPSNIKSAPSKVPPTKLTFATDDDDGIIACTFESHSRPKGFTFVVHRSALLRVYDEDTPPLVTFRKGVRGLEKFVPWSEWGSQYTRWLDVECSLRWICYVHGHRLAVLEKKRKKFDGNGTYYYDEDDPEAKAKYERFRDFIQAAKQTSSPVMHLTEDQRLQVFDISPDENYAYLRVFNFNPTEVKRAIAEGSATIGQAGTDPEERCDKGQVLVLGEGYCMGRIETSLPYLETTVRLREIGYAGRRGHIEGVMMNGESIIMMMAKDGHNTESVEVLNV